MCAGVWVGAGHSLAQLQALLEKLLLQLPEDKTELIRALIQQLDNVGSQQIRNVAVSCPGKNFFCLDCFCSIFNFYTLVHF